MDPTQRVKKLNSAMALMSIKDNTSTAFLQPKYVNQAITATATSPRYAQAINKIFACK